MSKMGGWLIGVDCFNALAAGSQQHPLVHCIIPFYLHLEIKLNTNEFWKVNLKSTFGIIAIKMQS